MTNETEKIASTHLGKKSIGSETYNPELLVAIPRKENRTQYKIDEQNLPFDGLDVWHAYEFSVLTNNGLPITRVLKIKYNCNSKFLAESKSLKLYLNSFNMTKFGENPQECLSACKSLIEKDLSNVLQTQVSVEYLDDNSTRVELFEGYKNLYDCIDINQIIIKSYKETPEVLKIIKTEQTKEYKLKFNSLRSNCRVTHQPDFGDVFIYYRSQNHILEDSLVKYLTSFRTEFHFHEECCEMIYKRLYDLLDTDDCLFVCALYTRRGGIDINPIRYSHNFSISDANALKDLKKYARNGIKQ